MKKLLSSAIVAVLVHRQLSILRRYFASHPFSQKIQPIPATVFTDCTKTELGCNADARSPDEKPTMLLHIGISKTGTTSLQCTLAWSLLENSSFWNADNYTYIGTNPGCQVPRNRFLRHHPKSFYIEQFSWEDIAGNYASKDDAIYRTECGSFMERPAEVPSNNISLARGFQDVLASTRNKGQNGILIFEGFERASDNHIAVLAEGLRGWNVKVVINYRRLYEWFPSWYNELTKGKFEFPRKGVRPARSKDLLPFALEDRGKLSELFRDIERTGQHPTETVRKRYSKYFGDITILKMHDFPNDLSYKQHLFCDVIRNAPHICSALKSGTTKMITPAGMSNPSVEFEYDILVMAAYKRGIVHSNPNKTLVLRHQASTAAKQRQEQVLGKKAKDFPLLCFSNATLERFLNLSFTVEQNMFGYSMKQDQQHKKGFAEAVDKKKFCHVNATAVLENADWHSFLSSL